MQDEEDRAALHRAVPQDGARGRQMRLHRTRRRTLRLVKGTSGDPQSADRGQPPRGGDLHALGRVQALRRRQHGDPDLHQTGHGGTDKVWFYDMQADGLSLDDKRTPIAQNDIPDIIERFRNREKEADRARTEKSFFVEKSEIAENGYDLSINKYKKVEYIPVEYPPTSELLADLKQLEAEIAKGLTELEGMLNG